MLHFNCIFSPTLWGIVLCVAFIHPLNDLHLPRKKILIKLEIKYKHDKHQTFTSLETNICVHPVINFKPTQKHNEAAAGESPILNQNSWYFTSVKTQPVCCTLWNQCNQLEKMILFHKTKLSAAAATPKNICNRWHCLCLSHFSQ